MKKDIHPNYNTKATIACACGASFEVGSTKDHIDVELCSACHPFYTGKQKIVDSARRVDRFEKRVAKAGALAETRKGKKVKRARAVAKKQSKEIKDAGQEAPVQA